VLIVEMLEQGAVNYLFIEAVYPMPDITVADILNEL
jgi:hypothetical protein